MVDTKNNNEIAVSVILPVYNVERFLSQCLDSLIQQTLRNIEIICVDDGSTDRSVEILENYAKRDKRIRIVHQPNAGAGAARNSGMKIARGKYLSFLDSDDFYELEMLEKAYLKCEKDDADICVYRSNQYNQQTSKYTDMSWTIKRKYLPKRIPFTAQQIYPYIFQLFNGWAWDKLYNRAFVERNELNFQEIRTTNDAYFVFMANVLANKITIVDEVLAHHRINVKTSLSVTREVSWNCCWQATEAIKAELQKKNIYNSVEQSFLNWSIHFLLWNVNTLQGTARDSLMDAIQMQYADKLHIQQCSQKDFYDSYEYYNFLKIYQLGKAAKIKETNIHKTIRSIRANGVATTIQKIIEKYKMWMRREL